MNRTALHDWHAAHGGRMVDFAGWQMPIQYTSIIDEHLAVRRQGGVFDIAHMGRLRFTGPDACAALDRLLTNDVTRLQPGQVRYSLICNESGGILDDVLVYRFETSYMLVVNASNREKIALWITQHLGDADVAMNDETFATFMLALQGPRSLESLAPLTPVDLKGMGYYTAMETTVDGTPATLSRTGYTGEDGFEVIVSADRGLTLWETLIDTESDRAPTACGLGARDTLRLEAAMPLYGHEMDEQTDPLTAGLSFAVKLKAGDFIGKKAIQAIKDQGPTKKRVGLTLEGRRIAREGATILRDGREVGEVTSGTFSPTLQQSIAMAYVANDAAEIQTQLEVDIRGKPVPACVGSLPFYTRPSD